MVLRLFVSHSGHKAELGADPPDRIETSKIDRVANTGASKT